MSKGLALLLIPLLPLAAALTGYVLARFKPLFAAWLGIASLAASAGLGLQLLLLGGGAERSLAWFSLPATYTVKRETLAWMMGVELAFHASAAQLLFVLTTAVIGLGVLLYALRDRKGDARAGQFFATLTLFAGSMLLFLTADTLLVIYISWELMGLCSFLLIAHKGTKEAVRAGKQAFWTTRATDFGLLFAVLIMMFRFEWVNLSQVDAAGWFADMQQAAGAAGLEPAAIAAMLATQDAWLAAAAVLTILAVVGKSALLPLSFWLPDAMVAPAPVSALLHAATMVAAGPYLLVQLSGMLEQTGIGLTLAVVFGGISLLAGGLMALCANDPKRILAYSTISHLGLVVLGVGLLAPQAAYFHLLAHAWFKAALFIAVGWLVSLYLEKHAMPGDAPSLGDLAGSARQLRAPSWTLQLAGLSLAGVWGLGGFFGKEGILAAALGGDPATGRFAAVMLILALVVTAAYITRLVGTLCSGKAAAPGPVTATDPAQPAEPGKASGGWTTSSAVMLAMAVVGGFGISFSYKWYAGLSGMERVGQAGPVLTLASMALIALGAWLAINYVVTGPQRGAALLKHKWLDKLRLVFASGLYMREVFHTLIAQVGEMLAYIAAIADEGVVDWLAHRAGSGGRLLAAICRWLDDHVVDGARYWACEIWWILKRLHAKTMQTGRIQRYMLVILIATVLLCFVVMKPLGQTLAPLIETLMQEGVI